MAKSKKVNKKELKCEFFGNAGWSANPLDNNLPFNYCNECNKQKECKEKDLINQENYAYEKGIEKIYEENEE